MVDVHMCVLVWSNVAMLRIGYVFVRCIMCVLYNSVVLMCGLL